ncbi:hypothetical protein ACMFMG_004438 [Clarireedia jacksonii]
MQAYCEWPFYTSSPSCQRWCICPSEASPALSASHPSTFPMSSSWHLALPELCLGSQLLSRLLLGVCVVGLSGIWIVAMGSSYKIVSLSNRTDTDYGSNSIELTIEDLQKVHS